MVDEIHAKGTQLWKQYERSDAQGGGRISQYLQHCTTKRIDFKEWRIDTMSEQIEPLLAAVEPHLRPGVQILPPVRIVEFQGPFSASTATATITATAAVDPLAILKKRIPQ